MDKKIRILHVLWNAAVGGIEKLAHDLAVEQARDSTLNVAVLFGQDVGQFREKFENSKLQLHFMDFASGGDVAPWKVRRATRLMRTYDLIHVHAFVTPLALAIARSGRRVVYTEHGNFGFGRKLGWRDWVKGVALRWFLKNHVDYLTFNSEFTRSVWEGRYHLPHLRRSVVRNGIAFDDFTLPMPSYQTGLERTLAGAFVIGTTSRFAGFKRIDRLLKSFARFQPGRNAKLLLVGDGVLRRDMEVLAQKLGVAEKTVFTGFRNDVRACQGLMDVCVFPSEKEPFGLVAVETLSLGKATVVFADGGGIADIVRPMCAEDVVSDEAALVKRLVYYYENRSDGEQLRERRNEHARQFNIQVTAATFRKIYTSLDLC
jgi:glycosyltransferase involved in cell wall biosynthesis